MAKHTAHATSRLTAFGEAVLTWPYCPAMLDDLKAAFRCLAKLHHPDVNGDPEAMRALNEARDALKELVAL